MAPHRKIPLFLLPILLILLAGAVVLLVGGQPLTLERIFHRQGYAITGQTETALTLTLSRDQMPEGFPEEVPISQAEGELELLLYQDRDTSFYLTAFAQSNQDSDISTPASSSGTSCPGRAGSSSSPTRSTRTAASPSAWASTARASGRRGGPARGRAPGRPEQQPVRSVYRPGPLPPLRRAQLPDRPLLLSDLRAQLKEVSRHVHPADQERPLYCLL